MRQIQGQPIMLIGADMVVLSDSGENTVTTSVFGIQPFAVPAAELQTLYERVCNKAVVLDGLLQEVAG